MIIVSPLSSCRLYYPLIRNHVMELSPKEGVHRLRLRPYMSDLYHVVEIGLVQTNPLLGPDPVQRIVTQ